MSVIEKISFLFMPPIFDNEENKIKSNVLFYTSIATIIGFVLILGIHITDVNPYLLISIFIGLVLLVLSHVLLRFKKLALSSFLLIFTLLGFVFYQILITDDGIHDSSVLAIPGILIVAGMLLPKRQFYAVLLFIVIVISLLKLLEYHGIIQNRFGVNEKHFQDLFDILIILIVTAISIRILTQNVTENYILAKNREVLLREMNATKDKFFSIISHDMKTPFNSILGFSSLIKERIHEGDYNGAEEYASTLQKSAEQTMSLLLNLLDWSRSQTGKMEFKPELVDFDQIVSDTINVLEEPASQKSISINRIIPSNCMVFCDRNIVSTVIRNLISNSIKFTPQGGRIDIELNDDKNPFVVSVKDNGVGMHSDTLAKLFRIDVNYTSLGTANEKGTGLGLLLCNEFIQAHGGEIWVESEIGVGSIFYFTIPQNEERTQINNSL